MTSIAFAVAGLCANDTGAATSLLHPAGRVVLAQGEARIPSDAQLERMEQRAIATPPLDETAARNLRGGQEAEIRQMDERAHRIDERLMRDGGICADCK